MRRGTWSSSSLVGNTRMGSSETRLAILASQSAVRSCLARLSLSASTPVLLACRSTPRIGAPATGMGAPAPALVVSPGDWPAYNRTLAGDRFSPLSEINAANVAQLRTICTYTLPEVTALQTGPIVINGTMYSTTDTISYAVDAGTCAEKWKSVRH